MLSPHFQEGKAEARRGNKQAQVTELASGIALQALEGRSLLVLGLPTPILPGAPPGIHLACHFHGQRPWSADASLRWPAWWG